MKRLSFTVQFKIEFLLLFAGCRKVLGKMPIYIYIYIYNYISDNFINKWSNIYKNK